MKDLPASKDAHEKIVNIARFYVKLRHVGSSIVVEDSDNYTASM